MKATTLLTLILLTATVALGQGVAINETGASPDPSAMLDVSSTSKGLLVPRMTIAQRNAIVLPKPGLLIFQTDATPGFYYNANTASSPNWQRLGDGSAGQWTISGDNIYYNAGNVGIGTNTPAAQLHTLGLGTGQGNVLFTGENKPVSPGNPPATGPGTRLMWYPDKAAFRSGQVTGTQWDKDNIGHLSSAWGENNKANGMAATAFGTSSGAAGLAATAWGSSVANGDYSTSWGFGYADGASATAWGESEANGDLSTSWGTAIANGDFATAWGSSQAQGIYATAWGVGTTAPSYAETVLGRYNEIYSPFGPDVWNPVDRLFVIGNGNSHMQRANALTVLKNGRIGMGISQPLALLHTHGVGTGEGNVLFTGQYKSDAGAGNPPATGAGTRMMWYPDKAAFRAGFVVTDQWNKDNIGFHSFAMGSSNKASGRYSAAWGTNSTASGDGATAWGYINNATGDFSTAFGDGANASGKYSTAWGRLTSAPSFAETVIGQYNLIYTPASATSWNANDRLFVIANGASAGTRSNAVTVMKSGNVGIGTAAPETSAILDVESTSKGFLPPRMTTQQRNAISTPVEGLTIYNTDKSSLEWFTGEGWFTAVKNVETGTVTDVDGNTYVTVKIGSQWWMAENLKTTKYSNNTPIENPTGNTAWENNTLGAYVWYSNAIGNKHLYGALYNWHAVNNTNGLCPAGWHVPTDAEWTTLIAYIDPGARPDPDDYIQSNSAGGRLKSMRTSPDAHPRWNSPNLGASNIFDFSGLPGGSRGTNGVFYNIGFYGFWWSSTEYYTSGAWYRYLHYGDGDVVRFNHAKTNGFSVRCLRD